ncbi:MAG: OsmC family protein [Candidatus Competibacteraceae bacterium]|nr:OsmC family protein [Candidatus Competibacteraceae bacterium]
MKKHHVALRWEKGIRFEADIMGNKIWLDGNPTKENQDIGLKPKPLMLAALAGCTAMDVASLLQKMRIDFSHLSVDVNGSLSDEEPQTYRQAEIIYSIRIANEDREKMEKAVKLSQEKYCGVSFMFRQFSDVVFRIEYL